MTSIEGSTPAVVTGRGWGLPELSLIGVAASWGLTFTLVQDAIATLPPSAFVAYRFLAAGLVLALVFHRGVYSLPARGWGVGVILGVILAGGYVSQTIGLRYTSASNSGFITGLFVIFTPLLGWLVLRRRLGMWTWTWIAVATIGLALLSGFGDRWHPWGDGLTLLCGILFAVHILYTDHAVSRFAVGPLVAVSLSVSGLIALLAAMGMNELVVPRGPTVWGTLVFTAVFASALAYFIQSYAQTRVPPVRVSLILAGEPVFAGVFGYWLAGDRLSATGWIGAAAMILAVVAMELSPARTARSERRREAQGARPPSNTVDPAGSARPPADVPDLPDPQTHRAVQTSENSG